MERELLKKVEELKRDREKLIPELLEQPCQQPVGVRLRKCPARASRCSTNGVKGAEL